MLTPTTWVPSADGSISPTPTNAFATVDTGALFITADTGSILVTE